MPLTSQPSPAKEAAALLADVQRRALRGMVWAALVFLPLQLYLWHRVPLAQRGPVSLIVESILVLGVGGQYLLLNRLSAAHSGMWYVTWLGAIDVIAWINAGPQMGVGIALVCTMLVALFFINKRAGAAVVLAFGLLIVIHAWLVHRGVLAPYPTTSGQLADARRLLLLGLTPFAALVVCYVSVALIHHELFRTLARVAEERRNRALAEASQRQAEETMRANQHFEALGKLSSGVAHDVNNALTVILCQAELLKLVLPAGETRQQAGDILSAARSAAQTTRHLLSLSRRSFCVPVSLDPAAELKTANRLAARLLPEGIWISTENRGQRRLLADPADLQQALLNLLINARDAMPRGGAITLAHEDVTLPDGRPGVAVRVQDNGTGIPPEVQTRIFEPFFTTKGPGLGTGLGLPMVKSFVEETGGVIDVQSTPGKGTTISLLFPESSLPATGDTADLPPAPTGQRLLLVEDRDDLRGLLERTLRRGGYEVTACSSSEEALAELAAGARFDVLCTDGFGGSTPVIDVISRFRTGQPAAPVLLFSGHADHEIAAEGLDSLQVELLRKPFTGAELLARLAALARA